jgi:fumarate hydratase class II
MIAVQVIANDMAVSFGSAGGYLKMNVYKPLMIFNIAHSIIILSDGCANFRKFLGREHAAEPEEDQGIYRSFVDARHGARACHWL